MNNISARHDWGCTSSLEQSNGDLSKLLLAGLAYGYPRTSSISCGMTLNSIAY